MDNVNKCKQNWEYNERVKNIPFPLLPKKAALNVASFSSTSLTTNLIHYSNFIEITN